jgi:hypothetical protein
MCENLQSLAADLIGATQWLARCEAEYTRPCDDLDTLLERAQSLDYAQQDLDAAERTVAEYVPPFEPGTGWHDGYDAAVFDSMDEPHSFDLHRARVRAEHPELDEPAAMAEPSGTSELSDAEISKLLGVEPDKPEQPPDYKQRHDAKFARSRQTREEMAAAYESLTGYSLDRGPKHGGPPSRLPAPPRHPTDTMREAYTTLTGHSPWEI